MIKYKVLFQFIFLSSLILNSCTSSQNESISEPKKGGILNLSIISPNAGNRDSTVILSFYEILSKDTIRLKQIDFNNGYELKNRIKFSKLVSRANLSGNVVIEFEIDSSGRGYNVRELSDIGGGASKSIAEAIYQFKFDYMQNIYSEGYPILLIAYIKLSTPVKQFNVEWVPTIGLTHAPTRFN